MNIQPLVEVNDEEFNILQRLSIEHEVTVEQYLVRILEGHVKYVLKAESEGYFPWDKTKEESVT